MADFENEEINALRLEFEWLLNEEVSVILAQMQNILLECCRRMPVTIPDLESLVKTEKYSLSQNTGQQDQLKISVHLLGDNISFADINLRLHKHTVPNQRFIVQNDCQWKLNQIQDASNHLMAALSYLSAPPLRFDEDGNKFDFTSADEVIQMINNVMNCLHKGRNALIVPKKRTIEELQNSRNMKSLQPPVPNDLAISFYIQSHKLICAIYHMQKDQHGFTKFDIFQAETSVPWLSEVLVLFTVALQVCQQLKDKVAVFSQYKDMNINNLFAPSLN
ncbi:protein rogdi-like protein [Dinothrombium tinctorium]|uniref:Protein rogdi-like protein n=1 Tax=Dinothrombium tinctorium TaxID=1965070 RepID=A0A3S3P6P8_9ACAR|nr:protein rogdi-like protein [Dinothrombium tinctorium]